MITEFIQTFVVIEPKIDNNELTFEIIGVYSDRQTAIRAKHHSDNYYITECYNNLIYDSDLKLMQKKKLLELKDKPSEYTARLNDRGNYELQFIHDDQITAIRTNQMSPRQFHSLDDIVPLLKELDQTNMIVNISEL